MTDDVLKDRLLLDYMNIRYKIKDMLEETQHYKDHNHNELHTDWIINKLKAILE